MSAIIMTEMPCPSCKAMIPLPEDLQQDLRLSCPGCGKSLRLVIPPANPPEEMRDTLIDPTGGESTSTISQLIELPNKPLRSSDPLIGEILGGCMVESRVGKGAMGVVYKAQHLLMERHVAIKVLNEQLSADGTMLTRFVREARTASQINHPNLIQVYDSGVRDGRYYFVMEFVEGLTLEQILEERGALPVDEMIEFTLQTCRGLAVAHNAGVIHRDIKPANLLVQDGQMKISDFGLARDLGGDNSITQTGQLLGSPRYMSPEQCRCDPLDTRSDIYALGVTVYHLITGEPPFDGPITLVLMKHINQDPIPPCEVQKSCPIGLSDIILKMMAKAPVDRYQTVEQVAEALEAFRSRSSSALTVEMSQDGSSDSSGIKARRSSRDESSDASGVKARRTAMPTPTPGSRPGGRARGRGKQKQRLRPASRATRTTGTHTRRRRGKQGNHATMLAIGAVFVALVLLLVLIASSSGPTEEELLAEEVREQVAANPGDPGREDPGPVDPNKQDPGKDKQKQPDPGKDKQKQPDPGKDKSKQLDPPVRPTAVAALRNLRRAIADENRSVVKSLLAEYRVVAPSPTAETQVLLARELRDLGMLQQAVEELARGSGVAGNSDAQELIRGLRDEVVPRMQKDLPDVPDYPLAATLNKLDPDFYFYHLPVAIRLSQYRNFDRAIHHATMALERPGSFNLFFRQIALRVRCKACGIRRKWAQVLVDSGALLSMVRATKLSEILFWRFNAQMGTGDFKAARRTVTLAQKYPGKEFSTTTAISRVADKLGEGTTTDEDVRRAYRVVCRITDDTASQLRVDDEIVAIDDNEPLDFDSRLPRQLNDLKDGRISVKVFVMRGGRRLELTLKKSEVIRIDGVIYVKPVGSQ